jgi:hypothetical protein
MDRVVMTHEGALIFTDLTGELVEDAVAQRYYPDVSSAGVTLVWATWRKPTHSELVKAWPAHGPVHGSAADWLALSATELRRAATADAA